jgi:hypothetical protein
MKLKLAKLQDKFDEEVLEKPIELQVQDKFIQFKKAEQDLFETLNKITDEERLIGVLEQLNKLSDNQIKLKRTKESPSYIG